MKEVWRIFALGLAVALGSASHTSADGSGGGSSCSGLPSHGQLRAALVAAVAAEGSGLNNHMWATLVNRDGIVLRGRVLGRGPRRPVARQPRDLGAEGQHGERVQPGQQLLQQRIGQPTGLALSTANLYSAVAAGRQPLWLAGQQSRRYRFAYPGPAARFGRANDPWSGAESAA